MLRILNQSQRVLTLSTLCVMLSACTQTPDANQEHPGSKNLRVSAIHDAALTYGAQAGLAWQSKNILNIAEQESHRLDRIFNFNAMLMKNSLLPPILVESRNSLNLAQNTIRLSDRIIEIKQPARFVSTPPTWRDYIQFNYTFPKQPHTTLLPTNAYERDVWDQAIQKGWAQGITQANNMLYAILGKLEQDFSGIALYHALYAQNMVSAPQTARAHLGVTGNQKHMRVNDQLIRITAHSDLNTHMPGYWNPAVIQLKHHE